MVLNHMHEDDNLKRYGHCFLLLFDVSAWKGMLQFLMFLLDSRIWYRITFLASVWYSIHGLFNGVLLANIQRD